MSLSKNILAKRGEEIASNYLIKTGFEILERNFRTRNGEIDIIAIDKSEREKVLAFIEVKTRLTTEFGDPLESITYYKMQALLRTANFYKMLHKDLPDLLRIDALAIIMTPSGNVQSIKLIKNINHF